MSPSVGRSRLAVSVCVARLDVTGFRRYVRLCFFDAAAIAAGPVGGAGGARERRRRARHCPYGPGAATAGRVSAPR
ncbi:hypothetical protein [Streptomyces sp. NPDC088135]|uniref:hypothetical protein n=1 Tax=Streptomyces sp. NPDC088135 TaxID=3160993 RepID=UPI0034273E5E